MTSKQSASKAARTPSRSQALAVDICDTVEFFYRHDPASSRRVKGERWGIVYESTAEPATPPGPPTPPAP